MIIVDLSQVCISNLMLTLRGQKDIDVDIGILRHLILNQIRSFNTKFKSEYGELIIACDNINYWRRQVFKYYKYKRKADRDKSELDWNKIFTNLNQIRSEIKEYFPYRVIEVSGAEADDIIGTLCHNFGNEELSFGQKILILSGDKDFGQLQIYQNVFQYNPILKKKIVIPNPKDFLLEHIIRGDVGDGIPNMLSDDDTFFSNKRQTVLRNTKFIDLVSRSKANMLSESEKRNFDRNKELIDLSCIPQNIQEKIIEEYNNQSGKTKSKLFNYFFKHKLKNLQELIGDF